MCGMSVPFLLSSDIRSEGSIAIVKKFDFDFLMIFGSTSLHYNVLKKKFGENAFVFVLPSLNAVSKSVDCYC